jgi:hypothetical protein
VTVQELVRTLDSDPIGLYIKRVKGTHPMLVSEYYMISAVTPEDGEVSYETIDQQLARSIHSELLGRQLNQDGTHSVTVRVPTCS